MQQDGIFFCGTEITRDYLNDLLKERYTLCNYTPGRMAIFGPGPYGGGFGYISGQLADDLGPEHDPWNFMVWSKRLHGEVGRPGRQKPETSDAVEDARRYWAEDLRRRYPAT